MIVGMWMTREPAWIEPEKPISGAAALMAAKGVRRLPVAIRRTDGPRLTGIITASDLFRAYPRHMNPFGVATPDLYPPDVLVSELMKRDPLTTNPPAPLEEPARAMCDHKVSGIPVVEKGVLVGIITESDIFRAFTTMLRSPPGSARITFPVVPDEDIFSMLSRTAAPRKVKVLSLITTVCHDSPVCVVRVCGEELDEFLDDLWKSGHQVLNVLRCH